MPTVMTVATVKHRTLTIKIKIIQLNKQTHTHTHTLKRNKRKKNPVENILFCLVIFFNKKKWKENENVYFGFCILTDINDKKKEYANKIDHKLNT